MTPLHHHYLTESRREFLKHTGAGIGALPQRQGGVGAPVYRRRDREREIGSVEEFYL